jgi:hypothetical protein
MKDLCLETYDTKLRKLILDENVSQLGKFGIQDHESIEWMNILTEEHGELAKAINDFWFSDGSAYRVKQEAIQVATLALKIVEMFGSIENMVDISRRL